MSSPTAVFVLIVVRGVLRPTYSIVTVCYPNTSSRTASPYFANGSAPLRYIHRFKCHKSLRFSFAAQIPLLLSPSFHNRNSPRRRPPQSSSSGLAGRRSRTRLGKREPRRPPRLRRRRPTTKRSKLTALRLFTSTTHAQLQQGTIPEMPPPP